MNAHDRIRELERQVIELTERLQALERSTYHTPDPLDIHFAKVTGTATAFVEKTLDEIHYTGNNSKRKDANGDDVKPGAFPLHDIPTGTHECWVLESAGRFWIIACRAWCYYETNSTDS